MGYRIDGFEEDGVYHIFTRGVEKRNIFLDYNDRIRFRLLLLHCLPNKTILSFSHAQKLKQKPELTSNGSGLVDILCYCLMDNHVHLLLRENVDGGITKYMQRILNSYAKYFNVRHDRTGVLFGGRFKSVPVISDEQLLHVSRYIHLNPTEAKIAKDPFAYPWSSLGQYIGESREEYSHPDFILDLMNGGYKEFVLDNIDHEQTCAAYPELLLDDE